MNKIMALGVVMFFTLFNLSALGESEESSVNEPDLIVYAYDSFVSDWGTGPQVIPIFQEQTGLEVELISAGDAGAVLSRVILEKDNPRADVVLGLDNNLLARAREEGVLEAYSPKNLDQIPAEYLFSEDRLLTPFDRGFFSIIYDSEVLTQPPKDLEELTDPRFENSLILMDPRTSSPGLGFLLWTIAEYGEDYLSYWERLMPNVLTITDGWDSGYGIFLEGEAPMVLSYTTSPAYHVEYEESIRYRAAMMDTHYLQIEGAGIVKGTKKLENAKLFLDFMISVEFQKQIPLTNWMYPVNPAVSLPESFAYAPQPSNFHSLDSEMIQSNQEKWIEDWVQALRN